MTDDDRSPYMTVPEVAAYLRLNEKTVYEMVKRGRLDYVRAGVVKGIRITRASVDRLLTQADPTAAAG